MSEGLPKKIGYCVADWIFERYLRSEALVARDAALWQFPQIGGRRRAECVAEHIVHHLDRGIVR